MAMTPEAKVKKAVSNKLKEMGAYFFFPATGGYGKSGVPDIVGCYESLFFAIECKSGRNQPTLLQEKHLSQISESGGLAMVVNEEGIEDVEMYLVETVKMLDGDPN